MNKKKRIPAKIVTGTLVASTNRLQRICMRHFEVKKFYNVHTFKVVGESLILLKE